MGIFPEWSLQLRPAGFIGDRGHRAEIQGHLCSGIREKDGGGGEPQIIAVKPEKGVLQGGM